MSHRAGAPFHGDATKANAASRRHDEVSACDGFNGGGDMSHRRMKSVFVKTITGVPA